MNTSSLGDSHPPCSAEGSLLLCRPLMWPEGANAALLWADTRAQSDVTPGSALLPLF